MIMRSSDVAATAASSPGAGSDHGFARPSAGSGQPAGGAAVSRPKSSPADPDGPDPVGALIDRLLPRQDPAMRTGIIASLSARLAERVASCWQLLATSIPGCLAVELRQLLELETDATGPAVVPPEFALLLDPGAAVAMLVADRAAEMTGMLLADPAPAVREAVLDALASDAALTRFDGACSRMLEARVSASLDRLNLSDRQRAEWHDRLAAREAPPPPPLHEEADEQALLAALQRGDRNAASMLLAAAALVPVESIERAIALRSRRGLVSLAWRAGFSMRMAVLLQSHLAGIQPDAVLVALPDGSCPLSRSEMVWQISFLARRLA